MGLKERGGRMATEVIPNIRKDTLRNVVLENVEPSSIVSTDELVSYSLLESDGFKHHTFKHGAKEFAYNYRHGATHHTNSVESFWHLFKASVHGTHIHVSQKYMQRYLDEFTFRSNHRAIGNAMFDLLIARV